MRRSVCSRISADRWPGDVLRRFGRSLPNDRHLRLAVPTSQDPPFASDAIASAGRLDERPVKQPPMRRSALLATERLRSKPFTHDFVAGARHELRGWSPRLCWGASAREPFRRTSYIGGALPGASRRDHVRAFMCVRCVIWGEPHALRGENTTTRGESWMCISSVPRNRRNGALVLGSRPLVYIHYANRPNSGIVCMWRNEVPAPQ
jgi:hypothetical protein